MTRFATPPIMLNAIKSKAINKQLAVVRHHYHYDCHNTAQTISPLKIALINKIRINPSWLILFEPVVYNVC